MPVTLNIEPPVFGSEGIEPDNPDPLWKTCRPLLKVSSTNIRKGSDLGTWHGCPYLFSWEEGLSFFTGCSPEGEDGTDSDVGTEGTPST